MKKCINVMYVVSDLKRVGPTNQTYNIITNSKYKSSSMVVKLFEESEDTMIDDYTKDGIKVISLGLDRKKFINQAIKKIRKIIRENQINIVHSYGIKPDYVCQKAIKHTNVKHVITLRNFPKEDIFNRMPIIPAFLAYCSHILTLKKATNIIACSETIKKKMQEKYGKMKITTIQNGVNTNKFKKVDKIKKENLRKELDIKEYKNIYISTSSFIPRKRIEETIKSFNRLEKENNLLLLLGNGIEFDYIYKKYKNCENILFVGNTSKVVEYLQASDVFISSSESEGLPNGVIEAIACGLPVIISNIPQHTEVMGQIQNAGITYELGNIDDFVKKMKLGINFDNSKCNIEESNLTMINMSKKYIEYYENITGEINEL